MDNFPNYDSASLKRLSLIADVGYSEDIIDSGSENIDEYDPIKLMEIAKLGITDVKQTLADNNYQVVDSYASSGVAYNQGFNTADLAEFLAPGQTMETRVDKALKPYQDQYEKLIAALTKVNGRQDGEKETLKEGDIVAQAKFLKDVVKTDKVMIFSVYGRDYNDGKAIGSMIGQGLLGLALGLKTIHVFYHVDFVYANVFILDVETGRVIYSGGGYYKEVEPKERTVTKLMVDNVAVLPKGKL